MEEKTYIKAKELKSKIRTFEFKMGEVKNALHEITTSTENDEDRVFTISEMDSNYEPKFTNEIVGVKEVINLLNNIVKGLENKLYDLRKEFESL